MKTFWTRILVFACLVLGLSTQAEDVRLNVSLAFSRAEAGDAPAEAGAVGDAWIFVLDHSGSMDEKDATVDFETAPNAAKKIMTRWKALLLALKATLDQIEPGSIVKLVKVGGPQADFVPSSRGIAIRSDHDREKIYQYIDLWGSPRGRTPLYQGLFLACQEAQRVISTENRNVCIVVFSDGKDESNNRYTQKDIDGFKKLFDEDGFIACLNWVSQSKRKDDLPPPPFGPKFVWGQPAKDNPIPIICRVRPRVAAMSMQNPLATGRARTTIPYDFALSPQRWASLLAEGMDVNVGLRTRDGADIGGEIVHLAKGATASEVVFQLDDSHFADGKAATFELALALPAGMKGCRFIQPRPVRVSFEERGAVTLSSVKPASGIIVKVGESISFSAEGTDGASYAWTFGDGAKASGARVTHAFANPAPNGVSFSVSAEKAGLAPAMHSGTIVVVPAGVKMDPPPTGVKVGDTAVFSCRGIGEVASYDWSVDGIPAVGEDAKDGASSRLPYKFEKAGNHTVRVRANMKRVSAEETPDVQFSVAPAPFAAIVKPEANERFGAEASIPLEASVEGGLANGVWTVRDAAGAVVGATIPAPVVNKVAKANFNAPEVGGEFTVSFEAGEGATAVSTAPVSFSVKAKDVRLDVVSPLKNASVRTGAPYELKASTMGLSGNVVFFLVDEAGRETRLDEAKIAADNSAAVSHSFPIKDGRGERTIIAKTADGKVVSDPVAFSLEMDADLRLTNPANNAPVSYGGSLDFSAEPSGVVEAKSIQWFLRPVGGVEEQIKGGTGAKYAHTFKEVPNRKSLSYEVYARAPLPDGSTIETDHVAIRASCPELIATIEAPKDIALGEEFSVRLKIDPKGATIKSVTWDFGDGTTNTAAATAVVKHKYAKEKTWTISATAICANCREERSFSVQTSTQCPALNPVLAIDREDSDEKDGTPFGRGRPIKMSVSYETPGASTRASDIRWSFGDESSETNLNPVVHSFVDFGEKTVSVTVRCSSCGKIETATRTIRIDRKPPKAHFKICKTTSSDKPAGSWVSQGGTIALASTSTGDVAGLRWSCNGEPMPEFDDTDMVEYDCKTVGKKVFSLVAIDPAGEGSEPETHSVRVYRLWLVLLLLFLALMSSGYFWWLFAGDDPRFWKLSAIAPGNDSLDENAAFEAMPASGRLLKKYWDIRNNRALVPLSDLGGRMSEDWGAKTPNGQTKLCLFESMVARADGDKTDRLPEAKLVQEPQGMILTSYNNGHLLKITANSATDASARTALWIKIDTARKKAGNEFLWYRIVITILIFGLAFALVARYAA